MKAYWHNCCDSEPALDPNSREFWFQPADRGGHERGNTMMGLSRQLFATFTLLVFASLSVGADIESGTRACQLKDYSTALKEFAPLAEQGNAVAQLFLGRMYMMGRGVLKDTDQAVKWFKASAAQGNADAHQFFLGSMYLLPQKNIGEGVKWLRLSAEQGNRDAQYLLGKAYIQGAKELARDPVHAEMWLRLAAEENFSFTRTSSLLRKDK
jgi:hypothetical protein